MKTLIALLLALAISGPIYAAAKADILAGDPFTVFVTVAAGTEPFAYQWRKDGVDIPGATGKEYAVNAATAADAGLYSVRVSNAAGSTISDNAAAAIVVKPSGVVAGIKKGTIPSTSPVGAASP